MPYFSCLFYLGCDREITLDSLAQVSPMLGICSIWTFASGTASLAPARCSAIRSRTWPRWATPVFVLSALRLDFVNHRFIIRQPADATLVKSNGFLAHNISACIYRNN
jgi:hypothetical protein